MSEKKSTPTELRVERIVEINSAIAIVGDMDMLSGEVAYRLGRLGEWSAAIAKLVNKEKTKLINQWKTEMKSPNTTPERKAEIQRIVDARMDAIYDLKETIEIPELKLSDFVAKTDCTIKTRNQDGSTESKEVKEGQMLAPQAFFSIMGDLIKDDKSTGKFDLKKTGNLAKFLERETDEEKKPEKSGKESGPVQEIKNKLNDKKSEPVIAGSDE
jgi:hypothetical protein